MTTLGVVVAVSAWLSGQCTRAESRAPALSSMRVYSLVCVDAAGFAVARARPRVPPARSSSRCRSGCRASCFLRPSLWPGVSPRRLSAANQLEPHFRLALCPQGVGLRSCLASRFATSPPCSCSCPVAFGSRPSCSSSAALSPAAGAAAAAPLRRPSSRASNVSLDSGQGDSNGLTRR